MLHMRGMILAAMALGALSVSAARAEECKPLQRYGVIPFEYTSGGNITLPASLAGQKTHIMLDTGAYWGNIRDDLVKALNLKVRSANGIIMIDLSGEQMTQVAVVPDVKIGNLNFGAAEFFVSTGDRDVPLEEEAGLLGQNLLTQVDLEIDNAHKTISLFSQDHCDGDGVHWADEAVVLEYKRQKAQGHTSTRIGQSIDANQIDPPIVIADFEGQPVPVLFDTGASFTSMDIDVARKRFGVTPSTPGVEPFGKVTVAAGGTLDTYKYTFKKLSIAGVNYENLPVLLAKFDNNTQVILGMHEMKHLHLYFAFKEGRIYITAADAGTKPGKP